METAHDRSACAVCRYDYDFEMPGAIVEAAREGRLVVFAGAGVSTEASKPFSYTLYDEVKSHLSDSPGDESFAGVMSAFEAEFGRLKLVELILNRLRFAETFPAVRGVATRFHRALSSVRSVMEIITTNWDPFFEQECGAMPIVVDGDYAFYNLPGRKVYKVHGSTSNVSTLVATRDDYAEAEERLRASAIGGTLRHLLATKIIVFAGFSLRDEDIQNIYEPLLEGMGKLRPPAYVVTPFESAEAASMGLRHIRTDGSHFARSLKAHLVEENVLLPDDSVSAVASLEELVRECHGETAEMAFREHPILVFSLAYQDGLLDIVTRIRDRRMTGEYNSRAHVHELVHTYTHLLHVAVERARYWDASYIDGYLNGLLSLLMGEEAIEHLPLYEFFDPEDFPATSDDMPGDGEVMSDSDESADADEDVKSAAEDEGGEGHEAVSYSRYGRWSVQRQERAA
jgi:hypothetical protein